MPTYTVHAINIGSFALGETDKVITLFSAERGILRAVAKGARKPGSKIAGRADVLNVNKLLLATGRTFEIISQAETIDTFPKLRQDLVRLSYGLYYAELTQHFGQGLGDESESFFEHLCWSLGQQAQAEEEAASLSLTFELYLLEQLGYKPEVDYCVNCREPLTDYKIALFHYEMGGIVCETCVTDERRVRVAERDTRSTSSLGSAHYAGAQALHITPLVWKRLVLARSGAGGQDHQNSTAAHLIRANQAARRVVQGYIEHRAGKRMKALDLIGQI